MSQVMATRHDGARPTDPPSLQWKMSCEVEVRVTTRQYFLVGPGVQCSPESGSPKIIPTVNEARKHSE